MNRTEYVNAIRMAGFSVRPAWQGRTEFAECRRDLTCYTISSRGGAPVTRMVVEDFDGDPGIDVFFAIPGGGVADDIEFLRRIARDAEGSA